MIELLNCKPKSYKCISIGGKSVRLHRHLMEIKIGRKLSFNEIVHHIDHDIHNNDLSNLEIVTRSNHIKIHPEIQVKSFKSKTKYIIDENLLRKLFSEERKTLKEIEK